MYNSYLFCCYMKRFVRYEDKDTAVLEQQAINEIETEKKILLKLIETFVSKKLFKDYLQKNIAAL